MSMLTLIQNEALVALNILVMLANGRFQSSRSILFDLLRRIERLKKANCHENIKAFLEQEVKQPEIINTFCQSIHLIKKKSNYRQLLIKSWFSSRETIFSSGNNCTKRNLYWKKFGSVRIAVGNNWSIELWQFYRQSWNRIRTIFFMHESINKFHLSIWSHRRVKSTFSSISR